MLISKLVVRNRPSTTTRHLIRGVKDISRFNDVQYKELNIAESRVCQELLSRVKVVTEVAQSKDIVENIMAKKEPIGVDMEGIIGGRISMVQVCDMERNISLFRTGINSSLYWEGGLARLLQAPRVIKIMHSSTVDCLSAYKDRVKLWNLYDTAVAFKVLEYQQFGTSVYSSPQIGFNALCNHFGLPENPLKERFKNILWRMAIAKDGKKGMDSEQNLDDEFLLYCAWDVDPLHQMYHLFSSRISPPYSHLVRQLSEIEIIRAVDPDLAKQKRKNLKAMEECNMFLSHLPSSVSPPDLYTQLSHIPGHKHIYFSHMQRTANIILDSREEVVAARNTFNEWGNNLGEGIKCKLVKETEENKMVEKDNTETVETPGIDSIDTRRCQDVIDRILEANCPVVVNFLQYPECTAVEIYIGTKENIKLVITRESVEVGRLGKLFSSSIVKVVCRIKTASVYSALKLLTSFGVKVRGMFDMTTAVNSMDYLNYGQSLFKPPAMSVQSMAKSLGLTVSTNQSHLLYMAYLHVIERIPDQFKKSLEDLAVLQTAIGSYVDVQDNKIKIREMKKQIDGCSVHLRLIGKASKPKQRKMKELVMETLLSKELVLLEYIDMGSCAIVKLNKVNEVSILMKELEKFDLSSELRFTVSSPQVLKTVIEKPARAVDLAALEMKTERNLAKLRVISINENYIGLKSNQIIRHNKFC